MKRITFRLLDTIQVFRLGTTTNAKISAGKEKILQSYTYSVDQYNYIKDTAVPTLKGFYSLDSKNCFDCPFSMNTGNGGCYTHKFGQYRGFLGMLRSMVKEYGNVENIPAYSPEIAETLIKSAVGTYVRFGSYGEPSLHPIKLVESICSVAKSWTGYTHQYFRKPEYASFFMASVHNAKQAETASKKFHYRSFIATAKADNINAVNCPASKESGFKANCSDCGLCSGTTGKGKKDVVILEH